MINKRIAKTISGIIHPATGHKGPDVE